MIPVPPHAPPAPEDPVHTLRDPDCEALKPAREHAHIECFDEEMNVIALDRELEDPKTTAAANTASVRSEGSPRCARSVTCNGWRAR